MRRSPAFAIAALAILGAGCGPSAAAPSGASPSATAGLPIGASVAPGAGTPTIPDDPCANGEPCSAAPSSPAGGLVMIHATFTGHFTDPLATADQTVDAQIVWKTGPDSIHDIEAFTFTSGSFTFTESIGGVCGGSRSESGPMNVLSGTALGSGAPQDQFSARVVMIDRRIEEVLLEFSAFSQFGVANPDAEGCGPLSISGVGSCRLLFHLVTLERLEPDASCAESGTTWTGHLEQT